MEKVQMFFTRSQRTQKLGLFHLKSNQIIIYGIKSIQLIFQKLDFT